MIDRGRHMVAIGAGAEKTGHGGGSHVLGGQGADGALHLELALMGRKIHRPGEPGNLRHVAIEGIDRGHADLGQHGAPIGIGERQIAHQCSPST